MEETLMRIRLALTLALRDQEQSVRTEAAQALERIEGVSALERLAARAESVDTPDALRALYAVSNIGGEKAFAILLKALQSPHADVRAAAVKLLAPTRDPRVVEHFIQTLDDPSPDVKILILEALGDFREPRLLQILTPKLQQSSGPMREALITALGRLGDTRAIEVLLPYLTDGAPLIRQRVAEALGHLGVRAAEGGEPKGVSPPA